MSADDSDRTGADAAALFRRWRGGDEKAGDALFAVMLGELETIATFLLKRESRTVSIDAGDLVNDAIVKLMQSAEVDIADRAHLLALSARVMRHALIDRIRKKHSEKRDAQLVALTTGVAEDARFSFDARALETAMIRLAQLSPERAQLVEMRYYAGMTVEEIAIVMGSSPATVKRQWAATRLWLKDAIADDR